MFDAAWVTAEIDKLDRAFDEAYAETFDDPGADGLETEPDSSIIADSDVTSIRIYQTRIMTPTCPS